MIADFASAIGYVMSPVPIAFLIFGTVSGLVFGAIPGLSGGMLIALCIPLTFGMDAKLALVMFVGMYVSSVAGGLVSATLLRMPGTPSSVMTTFDGYPMARQGCAGRALGLGIGASLVGGSLAGVVLVLLAPPLSRWAVHFGPWEYFTMVLMAIVLIASLSEGSMIRGLMSGFLGMLCAMPGISESDGNLRLTFGFHQLDAGFGLVPVLLGVFVVSQAIRDALGHGMQARQIDLQRGDSVLIPLRDWRPHLGNLLRSSVIGTWIGILPGLGASISSMIAYATAKGMSRTPERFGTGCEEGIVASEAANNANVGGALVPLVAMGIPGSPIDAILIGALILHNIQPGPLLFTNHADLTWAIIASYVVANVLMFVTMIASARWMARIIRIDASLLLPAIVVFCVLGAYATSNRMFDVWVLLAFGILGFFMERCRMPLGPFIIGFVLAPIMETELRSGLMASGGGLWPLLDRPFAAAFLAISIVMLFYPAAMARRRRRRPVATPAAGAK
jgi:putative tricarboxylic transport membrane protein